MIIATDREERATCVRAHTHGYASARRGRVRPTLMGRRHALARHLSSALVGMPHAQPRSAELIGPRQGSTFADRNTNQTKESSGDTRIERGANRTPAT